MSINQNSGPQTFQKGLYQAVFSFRLACWNVIYKAKRKLSLISRYEQLEEHASDTPSCQDYKEYEFVECLKEETQIIDLLALCKSQPHSAFSVHACNSSEFLVLQVVLDSIL